MAQDSYCVLVAGSGMLPGAVRFGREGVGVPEFEYTGFPSHVVFGVGSTERRQLARVIDALGAKRILLIAAEPERALACLLYTSRCLRA